MGDDLRWREELSRLLEEVKSPNARERAEAVESLNQFDEEREVRAQALIAALDDPHPRVRCAAVETLSRVWPAFNEAAPHLIRLLNDSDDRLRWWALVALGNLRPAPPETVAPLVALFDDPRLGGRAMVVVGGMREAAKAAVPPLLKRLSSPRGSAAAAEALGKIGPAAAVAVPDLCRAMDSRDLHTQYHAVVALGKIGPAAEAAVPALLDLVDSGDSAAAVEALRTARAQETAQCRVLISEEPWKMHRPWAGNLTAATALALWKIARHPRALEILRPLLTDDERDVRRDALKAAARIGEAAAPLASIISRLACSDPHWWVRSDAIAVVARLVPKAPNLVGAITYALGDDDDMPRWHAIGSLEQIGPAAVSAVDDLWKIALNDDEGCCISAAKAIAVITRDPAIIDVLLKWLTEGSSEGRQNAAEGLGAMGPLARRALGALEARLDDEWYAVRSAAAIAIERIETMI